MAQFTMFIGRTGQNDKFLKSFPTAEGKPTVDSEAEALNLVSEKFLDDIYRHNGSEDDEWLVQPEELDAYPVFDCNIDEEIIGWEVDSL